MMWLVAPPKIICRNLFLVKASVTNRSQPSALAAARTASPVLRSPSSMLMGSAAIPLYCNCLRTRSADGPGTVLSTDDSQHCHASGKVQQWHGQSVGAGLLHR